MDINKRFHSISTDGDRIDIFVRFLHYLKGLPDILIKEDAEKKMQPHRARPTLIDVLAADIESSLALVNDNQKNLCLKFLELNSGISGGNKKGQDFLNQAKKMVSEGKFSSDKEAICCLIREEISIISPYVKLQ